MARRSTLPDVQVSGGEDTRSWEDKRRLEELEAAAAALQEALDPGSSVDVTVRKKARYRMTAVQESGVGWLAGSSSLHVALSLDFISLFPRYDLTPVAKDAFWTVVGELAKRDARGRLIHMQGTGEIPMTQTDIAAKCRVSRQTVSGGMVQLMDRSFMWKAGRGRYQIHPEILYFGSAENQIEAIGYARAKRKDRELPQIPMPGTSVVIITKQGVKEITA